MKEEISEVIKRNIKTINSFVDENGVNNLNACVDDLEQLLAKRMEGKVSKVTRVEVIDENGRSYVNRDENNRVELSFQDDNRTLKIFISKYKQ